MTTSDSDYAGDVTAREAYEALEKDGDAVLVDVRTKAEWAFVGVADLSALSKDPVMLEWQHYPSGPASDFVPALTALLEAAPSGRDTPVYFLCRSGGRSASAARAMTQAGFGRCFNVAGGFEGPLDDSRHRGGVDGWKAADLPWMQS